MKVLPAVISFVLLLQYSCFGAVVNNYEDLMEASDHGHETGLANKEKRCHEPLHLPLYEHFLGANSPKLIPSVLKRRSPSYNEGPLVQMASRFKSDEPETGLSETQERYYTVGSFGPGPKLQVLAKLLNIPQTIPLERLVVLAKNKSKAKPSPGPHPIVIDTAHVFTKNDGRPAEIDLELHGVKDDQSEDLNALTSQLNKELDAAIDTKKIRLGDSHLTPQEIDKIIEHVVEGMKKKSPAVSINNKDIVGSAMNSEMDNDADGFKKKKKKGSKKHGFHDEHEDIVGSENSPNFKDDFSEVPARNDEEDVLGTQKGQGYGHALGHSKGYSKDKAHGKDKGTHYRENEDLENTEDAADINDDNPLHADMSEVTGMETPIRQHDKQMQKDIEELLEMEHNEEENMPEAIVGLKKTKGHGHSTGYKGGKGHSKTHYRENDADGDMEKDIPEEETLGSEGPENDVIQQIGKDDTLGTIMKGGYGKGSGGYGKGLGKGGLGKLKGLKGKGKGYYRENEDNENLDEPQVGSSQGYQGQHTPHFPETQGDYQGNYQPTGQYADAGGYEDGNGHGKTHYRENDAAGDIEKDIPEEETLGSEGPDNDDIQQDNKDETLGTIMNGGYGKGSGGYGKGSGGYGKGLGKGGLGKLKGLSLMKGKGKGYYRENEDNENLDEPQVGSSQGYQGQQIPHFPENQGDYQGNYQPAAQYSDAGNQEQYGGSQSGYDQGNGGHPVESYAGEPETYHGMGPSYPAPQSANQYQANYPTQAQSQAAYQQPVYQQEGYEQVQPQAAYQQPAYQQGGYEQTQPQTYQQPAYQQPQQYPNKAVQAPAAYQAPAQPQAAYSSSKYYKSVEPEGIEDEIPEGVDTVDAAESISRGDDVLGGSQNVPEDPNLKASFFENEVKRLRQWIADNGPTKAPIHRQHPESEEKEELVDKFTKVIEKDLTDGKKLTPIEKKNLDKKIAKMVRDNLNDPDQQDAEKKLKKRLDNLEDLVVEEADENEESDSVGNPKLGSNLDDFKSRFSSKADEDLKDDESTPRMKPKLGQLLKASLDNLKKDITTNKPIIDFKHIVEDLKAMPNSLMNGAGKLADMIKPTTGTPKLGSRLGLTDSDKNEDIVGQSKNLKRLTPKKDEELKDDKIKTAKDDKDDETVGCLEDLLDKKKNDEYPEWHMDPEYHYADNYDHGHGYEDHHHGHHDDYDGYRSNDKKKDALAELFKPHALKKGALFADTTGRSDEADETPKTLPALIKEIEENIEEKLHLPPLASLPAMRQSHTRHHGTPHHQNANIAPQPQGRTIPKIQVNGEEFVPSNQNVRPPLPEMPPRGLPQPAFQSRNMPEPAMGPDHFNMPLPNQNFQSFQGPQNFVGAPQPLPQRQPMRQPMPQNDMTHFGRIVPAHLHDMHLRDVTEQMQKHKMYFVGDGIKLPLHMHRHDDGTFHLSVDLEKLCKCNSTNCKSGKSSLKEPDFIATNLLGSKPEKNIDKDSAEDSEDAMDIEDVPLMMKTPNFEEEEQPSKNKKKITKRSPRFNYLDMKSSNSDKDTDEKTEEKLDYIQSIPQAIKDDVEHKIESFNKDIKDYYNNEVEIKKQKIEHGNLQGFLKKRVSLLSNILGLLHDVTFED